MVLKHVTHRIRAVRLLLIGAWPLWLGQACVVNIDTYTSLQILVQDSTGSPLAGFSVGALGVGSQGKSLTGPIVADKLVMTTDLNGRAEGRLHWHDNIERYTFLWNPSVSYPNFVDFYPCSSPLTDRCELNYDRTLAGATKSFVIRVKL